MLTVLDLFSGIGGFSLGLEATGGFRTIAFCEREPFARSVLEKHWPGTPVFDDVRTLGFFSLLAAGVGNPDVVCGGFPCQDISVAGKGAGLAGERSGLWFEFQRIIAETTPRFVIIENVAALRSRGLDTVLRGLASLGYDAEWHCIPASAIGAPHRRDRVWIVAHAGCVNVLGGSRERGGPGAPGTRGFTGGPGEHTFDVADTGRGCLQLGGTAGPVASPPGQSEGRGEGWKRLWGSVGGSGAFVADANGQREQQPGWAVASGGRRAFDGGSSVSDAGSVGLPSAEQSGRCEPIVTAADIRRAVAERCWRRSEPGVGGTADGVSDRLHRYPVEAEPWEGDTPRTVGRGVENRRPRLMALGNSVVPHIPTLIGRAILRAYGVA